MEFRHFWSPQESLRRRRYGSLNDWSLCALLWSYGVFDPEQSFARFQTQLRLGFADDFSRIFLPDLIFSAA